MRASHYEREARQLRERVLKADPRATVCAGGNALEDMCATLFNMGGGDIAKFARLLAAAAQGMRLSPESARALAAGCLATRAEILAGEEARGRYATRFAMGDDDKSLPFLAKKASPMSEAEQAWVWQRLAPHDSPHLIKRLARLGVSPQVLGEDGLSPLSKACSHSAANTLALLAAGADPNGEEGEEKSPLVRAFESAFEPGVDALVAAGADPIRSRVPEDLPRRVGSAARRGYHSHAAVAQLKTIKQKLAPLALALAERVALSKSALSAGPEGTAAKANRL